MWCGLYNCTTKVSFYFYISILIFVINIKNDGNFAGYFRTNVFDNEIVKGCVFIDKKLNGNQLKSVLREEITQSLGLGNDSWKYPKSIFYQGSNSNIKFAEIDEKIIQLHYNK